MLRSLRIDNFALIDSVSIDFRSGFTVITGETGSGKSILLNALNLILGERANFSIIGKHKDKSVVEAEMDLSSFALEDFFKTNDLDYFDNTILRREIYKQGRSRAFINDIPVQLNVLKDLTRRLIHIHSQYNTLELKDLGFQMEILDILAGTKTKLTDYRHKFERYQKDQKELAKLQESLQKITSTADYNQFQLSEILELDLDNINYEEVSNELKRLEGSDELKEIYQAINSGLMDDGGLTEQLSQLVGLINQSKVQDTEISELKDRLNSALIELRDIGDQAIESLDGIEMDPEKLMVLRSKLDAFNKILFKHRLNTQEDLMSYRDSLETEFGQSDQLESRLNELMRSIEQQKEMLEDLASDLHEQRILAIPDVESTIEDSLAQLKLTGTKLHFNLKKSEVLKESGISTIEMLFSPNKGIEPVPIHQAASGGELSRLMLSLQKLISHKVQLQTIFFDEIDTGVSGDVAQKMGETLKEMGENMQVIAVTHLPQVAAKGGQHLLVTKAVTDGLTNSRVTELNQNDRVHEVARLMSGDSITEAAIANAKALMN